MNPIDFSSLEKKSKTINKRSDELTEALTAINDRLNSLNLGIQLIDGPELERDETDERVVYSTLGYGKLRGNWGLLVITKEFNKTVDYDGEEVHGFPSTLRTQFLLSSPRHLRIEAVDEIEELIRLLAEETDNLEAAVGKAKKIAEKL